MNDFGYKLQLCCDFFKLFPAYLSVQIATD